MVELAAASLRMTGSLRLRVCGSSMLPAVRPGDVLRIRACDAAQATPGEVVLFRRGERLFAHRLMARGGDGLQTRGDAIASPDETVGGADLLGRVVAIERCGRTLPPPSRGSAIERAAALVFRRSAFAGRLFTRWHARRASRP